MVRPVDIRDRWEPDDFQYPPCPHDSQTEQRLYHRFRNIYEQHGHTWDIDSKVAWFDIIQRPCLPPSFFNGPTHHRITKLLTRGEVTWAHVVILKEIYGEHLFRSQKIMTIFNDVFPSAEFHTYDFHEAYKNISSRRSTIEPPNTQSAILGHPSAAQQFQRDPRAPVTSQTGNLSSVPEFRSLFGDVKSSRGDESNRTTTVESSGGEGSTEKSVCPIRSSIENGNTAPVGFLSGLEPSAQPIFNHSLRSGLSAHPTRGDMSLPAHGSSTPQIYSTWRSSTPQQYAQFKPPPQRPFLKRLKQESEHEYVARSPEETGGDSKGLWVSQVTLLEQRLASQEERCAKRDDEVRQLRRNDQEIRQVIDRLSHRIMQIQGAMISGEAHQHG